MKAANHVCSVFLRAIIVRMKQLGLNHTSLAARMHVSRPYIAKVLANVSEKRVRVSEGTRIAPRFARRARKGARDVNISFGTALKFAKALQMDLFPVLRAKEDAKEEAK